MIALKRAAAHIARNTERPLSLVAFLRMKSSSSLARCSQTSRPNYKEIDSDEERRLAARQALRREAREQQDGVPGQDDADSYQLSSTDSSSDSEVRGAVSQVN